MGFGFWDLGFRFDAVPLHVADAGDPVRLVPGEVADGDLWACDLHDMAPFVEGVVRSPIVGGSRSYMIVPSWDYLHAPLELNSTANTGL